MEKMTSFAFSAVRARAAEYLELTKMRLVSLVLLSTAVGFFLASRRFDGGLFAICLTGTGLVAAGSMALNQWWERREDAQMVRTLARPLPAGKLAPREAFWFGILLSTAGLALLYLQVNLETAFLAGLTLVTYVLLYTPLKKTTSLSTIVGAVPGALPPLIGWAAAAGTTTFEAWLLFAIIFLWQMPHFLAIAWLYRKDYAAAGFRMLSVTDPSGKQVSRQILLYSLALLPVSLLPSALGLLGPLYFLGAILFGLGFIALSIESLKNLDQKAGVLFRASILYLSGLLILMVLDKA
jgi:heme o synthase